MLSTSLVEISLGHWVGRTDSTTASTASYWACGGLSTTNIIDHRAQHMLPSNRSRGLNESRTMLGVKRRPTSRNMQLRQSLSILLQTNRKSSLKWSNRWAMLPHLQKKSSKVISSPRRRPSRGASQHLMLIGIRHGRSLLEDPCMFANLVKRSSSQQVQT